MSYKVRGISSNGESFYVDGSETGKVFATSEEAFEYGVKYARTVGWVQWLGENSLPLPLGSKAFIRTTKPDGYFEDIAVEVF